MYQIKFSSLEEFFPVYGVLFDVYGDRKHCVGATVINNTMITTQGFSTSQSITPFQTYHQTLITQSYCSQTEIHTLNNDINKQDLKMHNDLKCTSEIAKDAGLPEISGKFQRTCSTNH